MLDIVWKTKGGRHATLVRQSDGRWQPFYLTSTTNRKGLLGDSDSNPWVPFEGYDILHKFNDEGKLKHTRNWLNKGRHSGAHREGHELYGYSTLEQKQISDALEKQFGAFRFNLKPEHDETRRLIDMVLQPSRVSEGQVNRYLQKVGTRKSGQLEHMYGPGAREAMGH